MNTFGKSGFQSDQYINYQAAERQSKSKKRKYASQPRGVKGKRKGASDQVLPLVELPQRRVKDPFPKMTVFDNKVM